MGLFGRSVDYYFKGIETGSLPVNELRAFLQKSPDNVNAYASKGNFFTYSLLAETLRSPFKQQYLDLILEFKPKFSQPARLSNDPDDAERNIFYWASAQSGNSHLIPKFLSHGADPALLFTNGGEDIYAHIFKDICRACSLEQLKDLLEAGFESNYFKSNAHKNQERLKILFFVLLERAPLDTLLPDLKIKDHLNYFIEHEVIKQEILNHLFQKQPDLFKEVYFAPLITAKHNFLYGLPLTSAVFKTIVDHKMIPLFKKCLISRYKDAQYFDSDFFKFMLDHAVTQLDDLKSITLEKQFSWENIESIQNVPLLKDSLSDIILDIAFRDIAQNKFKLPPYLLKGYDINWVHSKSKKPLLFAATHNANINLLKELIENGADLSITDKNGQSFMEFLSLGDRAKIEAFLEKRNPAVIALPPIKITDSLKMEEIFLFDRGEVLVRVSQYDGTNPSQSIRPFSEMPEHVLEQAFNQHTKRGGQKTPADYNLKTKDPAFKIKALATK